MNEFSDAGSIPAISTTVNPHEQLVCAGVLFFDHTFYFAT